MLSRSFISCRSQPELALAPKPYLDVAELTPVQLMHELGYDVPE